MRRFVRIPTVLALAATIAALSVWGATGRHYYTKFEVVEKQQVAIADDDPLAGTGFYDDEATETVRRDEFHLGLLPTPQGLFDKHLLSVATILAATWSLWAVFGWWLPRRRAERLS